MISPIDTGPVSYCDKCGVDFCLFPFHLRLFHDGKRENKCAFCGSPFLTRNALLGHIELHNDRGDLFCCRCLLRFDTDDALVEHLESHRELHVYFCVKCQRTFASKAGWGSHECSTEVVACRLEKASPCKSKDDNGIRVACSPPVPKPKNQTSPVKEVSDNSCLMTLRRGPIVKVKKRKLQMSPNTFSDSLPPRRSFKSRRTDLHITDVPVIRMKKELLGTNVVPAPNRTSQAELIDDLPPQYCPDVFIANVKNESDPNNLNCIVEKPVKVVTRRRRENYNIFKKMCSNATSPSSGSASNDGCSANRRNPAKSGTKRSTMKTIKIEEEDEVSLDQLPIPLLTMVNEGLNLVDTELDIRSEAPLPNMMNLEFSELNSVTSSTPLEALDSVSKKKKAIKFNEKIEFWNPVLDERMWLAITDESVETREVPLLLPHPVNKRKKVTRSKKQKGNEKKKNKKKKNKNKRKTPRTPTSTDLIKPAKATKRLEPPKPSNIDLDAFADEMLKKGKDAIEKKPRKKMVLTKSRLMNDKNLLKKYGGDFHYDQCVKEDGRYRCPESDCPNYRGFADVRGLRNHIRVHHIKSTRFTCWQCGKTFAVSCKLKAHMIAHSSTKGYVCDICGELFKTSATYTNHKGIHTQPWQCYHCDRRFSIKNSLKTHLRTSHCTCCNVTLRCAESFRRHEIEIDHVYSCMLCNYETSLRSRFSWHIGTAHYSETTKIDGSYKCEVCDRKFASRSNAVRHVRKKHSGLKSA